MTITPTAVDTALSQLRDDIAVVKASRLRAQNEGDVADRKLAMLTDRLSAIQVAATQLNGDTEAQAHLRSEQEWLANLTKWRAALLDELSALPNPLHDAHTLGVQQNLTISISIIDGLDAVADTGYDLTTLRLGALMRASGYEPEGADPRRSYSGVMPWLGSIPQVERRISNLVKLRTDADTRLADALLDDEERAKRDAEAAIRREASNALPVRKTRQDGSQYDRYPEGRVVEVPIETTTS